MSIEENPNVEVARDHHGIVRSLDHLQDPWSPQDAGNDTAQSVAHRYLQDLAEEFHIPTDTLSQPPDQLSAPGLVPDAPFELKLVGERDRHNENTAVTYQQTILGLPVWKAKVNLLLNGRNEVVSCHSSIHADASVPRMPKDDAKLLKDINENDLRQILGLGPDSGRIEINGQKLLVYLYQSNTRQIITGGGSEPEGDAHATPTLNLPQLPDTIHDGQYYVVREILFTFPLAGWGDLHWRTFVDVQTGTILYLRALVSGLECTGWVFPKDPVTKFGQTAPKVTGAATEIDAMNLLRERLPLPDINTATPQALSGKYVQLKDLEEPEVVPPTSSTGEFSGSVESHDFAATSAYFHVTTLFNTMDQLGISAKSFFKNTQLPLPVDHRAQNDRLNARCKANKKETGAESLLFGRAFKESQIGIAADFRVVAHEFCHALLYEAIHSGNFGFAHSAGDALGTILCDPESKAPDRFASFPWIPWLKRRHDREDLASWAWGGDEFQKDIDKGYQREQILTTTLFRIYRAIGGDATTDLARQTWASKYVVYLILGGIALITAEADNPVQYISSMMLADDKMILGSPGGAIRKVVRWAFEKQGAYNPIVFGTPVTTRGPPPNIDVYINDGREGEYDYTPKFDGAPDIWNRLSPDKGTSHQTPKPDATNSCYVRVKNRGWQPAQGVQVKVYRSTVASPTTWPADFKEITPSPAPSMPASIAAKGGEAIIGPFSWTPDKALPTQHILAAVSCPGDISNVDASSKLPCAAGPTRIDRLVPFDNNVALRKM